MKVTATAGALSPLRPAAPAVPLAFMMTRPLGKDRRIIPNRAVGGDPIVEFQDATDAERSAAAMSPLSAAIALLHAFTSAS